MYVLVREFYYHMLIQFQSSLSPAFNAQNARYKKNQLQLKFFLISLNTNADRTSLHTFGRNASSNIFQISIAYQDTCTWPHLFPNSAWSVTCIFPHAAYKYSTLHVVDNACSKGTVISRV